MFSEDEAICYKYIYNSIPEIFVPTRGFYFNRIDGIIRSDHPRSVKYDLIMLKDSVIRDLSYLCKDREAIMKTQRLYIAEIIK